MHVCLHVLVLPPTDAFCVRQMEQVDEGDAAGDGLKPDMLVSLTAPKLSARCKVVQSDVYTEVLRG